ncbi:hypothetical protein [Pseudofrankia sp. DC12]|uniref:hypothetical protein n=1 Tax=Pseudofrankia sp. DC12 TaxID=683315 RepID=UPI0005F7B8ED|nr:hypothetical protein [Pseudofrankia sp. DC12]
MVGLRSRRQDRTLLIVLWLFTVIVLVIGGLAVSGILLVWGAVGLIAAIFLTRIHVRDTRQPDAPGTAAGPENLTGQDAAPHEDGASPEGTAGDDDDTATATATASSKDAEESR